MIVLAKQWLLCKKLFFVTHAKGKRRISSARLLRALFCLKHVPPRSLWKWGKVRHLYLNLKERGTKRPAEICPLVFAKRLCNPFRRGLSIRRHAVSGELPAPLVILWEVLKRHDPAPIPRDYVFFTPKLKLSAI